MYFLLLLLPEAAGRLLFIPSTKTRTTRAGHQRVALLNQCGLGCKRWGHSVAFWSWASLGVTDIQQNWGLSMNCICSKKNVTFQQFVTKHYIVSLPTDCQNKNAFFFFEMCRYFVFRNPLQSPERIWPSSYAPAHCHLTPHRNADIWVLLLRIEGTCQGLRSGAPDILTPYLHLSPDPCLFPLPVHIHVPSAAPLATSLFTVCRWV